MTVPFRADTIEPARAYSSKEASAFMAPKHAIRAA